MDRYDAVPADLDGVITEHRHAVPGCVGWKTDVFDCTWVKSGATQRGEVFSPFPIRHGLPAYVDGKPRLRALAGFLNIARYSTSPEGSRTIPPASRTVVGSRKPQGRSGVNKIFEASGVDPYEGHRSNFLPQIPHQGSRSRRNLK